MALVQTIGFTPTLFTDNGYYEQSSKWDNIVVYTTTPVLDWASPFQGYSLNWGTYDNQNANIPFFNQQYSGYNTNWGSIQEDTVLGAFANNVYSGYNTNWGQTQELTATPASLVDIDLDSVIDHPKSQTIFYKLKGWNPLTLTYESWVISENITARTALDGALFDPIPGRTPPNVERDVFKTPPSGNSLTNIIIAARWIE